MAKHMRRWVSGPERAAHRDRSVAVAEQHGRAAVTGAGTSSGSISSSISHALASALLPSARIAEGGGRQAEDGLLSSVPSWPRTLMASNPASERLDVIERNKLGRWPLLES